MIINLFTPKGGDCSTGGDWSRRGGGLFPGSANKGKSQIDERHYRIAIAFATFL